MTHQFKDHFSPVAAAYRAFRPAYPPALFRWLADVSPRRDAALDCGCGTGQAAVGLAHHFARVFAVDPSREQIANAIRHERVTYLVEPAEATGLPSASQDLICAAQALHWFDLDRFYPEVRRLAREGAVFAAFTYGLIAVEREVDAVLGNLYRDILRHYWPAERRHVDDGYRSLPFPFPELSPPRLVMTAEWGVDELTGYLATWSAVREFKARTGGDPLEAVGAELRGAWGDAGKTKRVSWPLVIRAGRIE